MDKYDFHHDYLKIFEMLAPIEVKVRMLSILLGSTENAWHVVGITREALKILSENGFDYTSGINRAHKVSRDDTYKEMLNEVMEDKEKWWNFYIERDKTILATSSQNMRDELNDIVEFENNNYLFRASGFRFRYTNEEKKFLKELSSKTPS